MLFRSSRRDILRRRDRDDYKDFGYWKKRLDDLPSAPELPLAKQPAELDCDADRVGDDEEPHPGGGDVGERDQELGGQRVCPEDGGYL